MTLEQELESLKMQFYSTAKALESSNYQVQRIAKALGVSSVYDDIVEEIHRLHRVIAQLTKEQSAR